MEKGTRIVKCPNCLPEVTFIRIKITVEDYGKTGRVRCRKCLEYVEVTIPVPPTEESQDEEPTGFPFTDVFDIFKMKR
jgi:hypothetical protein